MKIFDSAINITVNWLAGPLVCLLLVELFFGYWFSEHNFGPYMREHRLKKNPIVLTYKGIQYDYIYKRNYYGFRGEEIDPASIKAIMIGGSAVDERYKPSEFTITENLNQLLKKKGYDLTVVNAGIEGQTTYGHIYNFKHWFPKIKNFSPKYYIFYIGASDYGGLSVDKEKEINLGADGHIKNPSKTEIFFDNFKSRSFFYDKLRILKQKYYLTDKIMSYDHDYYNNEERKKEYKYVNYKKALEIHNINNLEKKYKKRISSYLNRVKVLNDHVVSNGGVSIFINQVLSDGVKKEDLFIHNYALIDYCKKKKLYCIDFAKKFNGQLDYWYDGVHTSALGSKAIAEVIIGDLVEIIKKNETN